MADCEGAELRLLATKPDGPLGRRLRELGFRVDPLEEPAPVDRYIVSPRLAIERRTGAALLRGIQDKTVFTSAIHLVDAFQTAVLLLEGAIDYTYSGFDPRVVRGALSALVVEYGMSVLPTPDAEETAQLIAMMARHELLGVPDISLVPKRKAVDLPDLQRRVVEMLPGCGMVLARDLLQHFGSVRRIANATQDELLAVRGLGPGRVAEILRVLHAPYEAIDTERNLEDAIVACPSLLFDESAELLARQHVLFSEGGERHAIDLVFADRQAGAVVLVELKRGPLRHEHVAQLRRYLDHAAESALVGPLLAAGARLTGVLATVDEKLVEADDARITVARIVPERVIEVLARLRAARLGE